MANSVDLDDRADYELSHLNLHCLHRYLWDERVNLSCFNRSRYIVACAKRVDPDTPTYTS